jgi:hypothetical protein
VVNNMATNNTATNRAIDQLEIGNSSARINYRLNYMQRMTCKNKTGPMATGLHESRLATRRNILAQQLKLIIVG